MGEESIDVVKRAGTAAAMIGAPLVTALGFIVHPRVVTDPAAQLAIVAAEPGRWAVAHLLMLVGAVCFVPAAIGTMRRLGGSAAWAGLLGAALATIGAVFVGVVMGVDAFTASALAALPADQRVAVAPAWQAIEDGRGMVPFANLVALLSLGFLVLGAALLVARRTPRWASAAIALGTL